MDLTILAALFGGSVIAAASGTAGWLLRKHREAPPSADALREHTEALHTAAAEFARLPASMRVAAQEFRLALTAPALGVTPAPAEVPPAATFPAAPAVAKPVAWTLDSLAQLAPATYNPAAHPVDSEQLRDAMARMKDLLASLPQGQALPPAAPTPEPTAQTLPIADPAPAAPATVAAAA